MNTSNQDSAITGDREERKYLVAPEQTAALAQRLHDHLEAHHFRGTGANPLPNARHFTTTVYFDTLDRAIYRAARASENNVKLRAREYYDLHPELTELATTSRQLVRYTEVLWLELKSRAERHSAKRRIGIPKKQVPAFFEEGEVTTEMLAIPKEHHDAAALDDLIAFRARFDSPLRASCLVNYRRDAWEDEDGGLRVTIDRHLGAFAPPADLWSRDHALVRATLGEPVKVEAQHVLEIKTRSSLPDWLQDHLHELGVEEQRFSKLLMASEAVHGPI